MAGGSVLGADALIQGDVPCGAVREAVCSAEVVSVTKRSPNRRWSASQRGSISELSSETGRRHTPPAVPPGWPSPCCSKCRLRAGTDGLEP